MSDDGYYDGLPRSYYRTRNILGRAILYRGDDSKGVQSHQIEILPGEVRDQVQRVQQFGHSAMPLPGASAVILFQGGQRNAGTIIAVEDPRYRPRGLNPGEAHVYMVDGAGADGTGGILRSLVRGLAGWICEFTGKTINIGTAADTTTITIASGGAINITGASGDIIINGISHMHHTHPDAQGGETGEPQ